MNKKAQIDAAIEGLAATLPWSQINLTVIADKAGVSLPTVRKLVGGKTGLRPYMRQLGIASEIKDEQTPERLLDAARKVFAKQGYDGASLDDVAAAAGMTKGAVYHHFESKADLFWALAKRRLSNQMEVAGSSDGSPQQWDETRLQTVLSQVLLQSADDQDWARLHYEILSRTRDPDAKKHFVQQESFLLGRLTQTVKEAQEQGQARTDVAPEAVALLIAAVTERLMQYEMLQVGDPKISDLLPDIAKVIISGADSVS
jgi:TetR/AcrR family transcriptional regulator, acrAB operon repressor